MLLQLSLAFFVLALIAALFGFGGVAAGAAAMGKLFFFAFVILAVVALMANLVSSRRGPPRRP